MVFTRWAGLQAGVLVLAMALGAAPLVSQAQTKKRLVCWTDNAGNRACGDAVPAQYADKQKVILDGSGRTVRVIPGALTAEQRAEQDAQALIDAENQRIADKQAAHDRALTATYSSAQDIATLRDDRITTIDTQLDIAESAARRDAVSLAELRARLPAPESGQKPPVALVQNIEQFERSVADNERSAQDLRRKRENLCTESARDIERFQELKSGSVTFHSPCPPQGSLVADNAKPADLVAARAFFDAYVELEVESDPAYLERYADDAVLKQLRKQADGSLAATEQKAADWRAETLKTLPAAKEKRDPPLYSDIRVENAPQGRARVSGKRASGRGQVAAPFYLLIRPSGKDWKIVERGIEAG